MLAEFSNKKRAESEAEEQRRIAQRRQQELIEQECNKMFEDGATLFDPKTPNEGSLIKAISRAFVGSSGDISDMTPDEIHKCWRKPWEFIAKTGERVSGRLTARGGKSPRNPRSIFIRVDGLPELLHLRRDYSRILSEDVKGEDHNPTTVEVEFFKEIMRQIRLSS